jgi:hypothetical protein
MSSSFGLAAPSLAQALMAPLICSSFEIADQAYSHSMMLRGNFKEARRSFLAAYELEPANPLILSNLELLTAATGMCSGYRVSRRIDQGAIFVGATRGSVTPRYWHGALGAI